VNIRINVSGLDELEESLEGVCDRLDGSELEDVIEGILDEVKAASQEIAPYDTGELHDSAFVEVERADGGIIGRVGYRAEHALRVHELPELDHPQGQWKFLEQPFTERRAEILGTISRRVSDRIKAAFR
jgi:hypothetical protein